ncbi:sensor histidine kinase [Ruminococcus flavefaciens]|uniref:histidine kinase n=1 Tax=Ruminococcus flavefaciens TaxID=1265 RepID=A0A315Y3Y4_RUMFL|nr:HAMP domain-containing sensor histidine kinase [Ruminococcus flavefaciens]PWJ13579.1 signal transduction histidine kinase [Ruminococcus flavefaciens]SSA48113.1 Signal transduction histidine kinase [Ruminococcus flavefaciens]
MKNKKSSYDKLFIFIAVILLSLNIVIGVILITVSSAVYKSTKLDELQSIGDLFISCMQDNYLVTRDTRSETTKNLHKKFSSKYHLMIYIYDENGNCVLSDADYREDPKKVIKNSSKMTVAEVEKLSKKDFLDIESSNISASEPYMLYGTCFFLSGENDLVPSRMFAKIYAKSNDINSFSVKIAVFYTLFCALSLAVQLLLIKRRFNRLSAYENEFRRISEMYAKRDFSEQIPTDVPYTSPEIADYVNAVAADVAKSEETSKTFIANVSHELRTPITTIGGFVDGILDGTIPKTRQNEYLVLVSKEIKRLRILISSMLNMSRFETGTLRPNFRDVNLTEIVIQTVLMFEKKIEDKNLEVEGLGSERMSAEVDPDLIQQVVYNLVENAVKFINTGGTLSFRFERSINGICTIGIKNTGEGLKNDEISQVFDRFYKTDSSRGKDTTGLGLGLAISRKIVHLHHGHIVVKSVYGEYTEFLIQIPEKQPKKKG